MNLKCIRTVHCSDALEGCGENWIGILYRGEDIERTLESRVNKKYAQMISSITRGTGPTIM